MPITFTAIGDTLEATIIDGNFELWQDLFRSGLQKVDFGSTLSRFRIQRWQSGALVSVTTGAYPFRSDRDTTTEGINEIFDLTFRKGKETDALFATVSPRANQGPRSAYAMELLGKPGPSFYFQFQEDGLPDPSSYSAFGWPPSYWPINRFPASHCYSRWLTFPYASDRVFVPYPCVAKITGSAFGSVTAYAARVEQEAAGQDIWQTNINGFYMALRTGLIVDTNPTLHEDEFSNSNPHIVDPITGSQADFCSWKVVTERTIFSQQRQRFFLKGEVALKGNRWYNFAFKFRDAAHHGWLDHSTAPPIWMDDRWEDSIHAGVAGANEPIGRSIPSSVHPMQPPWVNLWESGSINLEFDYGRQTAGVHEYDHSDFLSKPPNPW